MDSQNNQYFTQQRPSYPQSASSFASISTSPSQTNMNSRHSPTLVSAAPVSSPSMNQSHFTSLPTALEQQNSYHFQQQQQQQHQHQQHRGSFSEQQRGTGNDTMSFLSNFSLLAEAAKRAEMAVVMRDFDDLEM